MDDNDLFRFVIDENFNIALSVSAIVLLVTLLIVVLIVAFRFAAGHFGLWRWSAFEIDEAEFGLGEQKITLRPNNTDKQIAYQIWVELSTRKIGLSIDLEDDVISDVYDSWYNFFAVTRELIKDVPVAKFRRRDTEKIIRLSIEVLNTGIRPHLTRWQARFRRWYENALKSEGQLDLAPQDLQQAFPQFEALKEDLLQVNKGLIRYREKMYELVSRV